MASLASINIKFTADLRQFSSELQNADRDLKKLGTAMGEVGNKLSIGLTLPILAFGAAAIKIYGDIQSLQLGLTSIMGSASEAGAEFNKLKEVAKLPGLGLEEAVRGSTNLQAAGYSADQARGTLLAFGNALATVGKGKNELNLVVLALTQLQNKSGGFAQDLRQLTEQLPQLRGALKDAFGTSDSEEIQKLGFTGKQVVEKLTAEFTKLPKVTGGIKNAFENVSDGVKLSMAKIGESINKNLDIEGKLNSVGEVLSGLADAFSELSPVAQSVILTIAGVAASIGPLLVVLAGVVTIGPAVVNGITLIKTAFIALKTAILANPIGIIVGAIVAVAAVSLLANSRLTSLTNATDEFADVSRKATTAVATEKAELTQLLATAKNKLLSDEKRIEAIERINAISPEHLGNIKLENIFTKEATAAVEKYTAALIVQAKVQAAKEKLVKVEEKLLDLQMGQVDAVQPSIWQNLANAALSAGNAGFFAANSAKTVAENFGTEYIELLKLEDKLTEFIGTNEKVAASQDALADSTESASKFKAGTVAFYEEQITALQKLQKEVPTTTGAWKGYERQIAAIQLKIDALQGKGFTPGTIAFYDLQISGLQKLQKEIPITNAAWQTYEDRITAIQKKIEAIEGKGPIKLPKPEVADAGTPELLFEPSMPEFSLEDLQGQMAYFQKRREMYATDAAGYIALSEQINNTEIKIKAIDTSALTLGKEEIANFTAFMKSEEDKRKLLFEQSAESNRAIATAFSDAFSQITNNVVDSMGLASTGFQGFVKSILKSIPALITALTAQSTAQAVANGSQTAGATGPAAAFTTGPMIAVAVGAVLAAMAAIPKFETGGIVGGSSYYGDQILARVNSSELILNRGQQKSLFGQLNSPATASDLMVQLVGELRLSGSDLLLGIKRAENDKNRLG